MVNNFNNAVFVEIGSWQGRSAIYMAEKIKESGKNIKFYAVDLFKVPQEYSDDLNHLGESFLNQYYNNIEPVKDYITTLVGDSKELYKNFNDQSIDFLFIDGDHSYKGVKADLTLWFPKIKIKGIIAGHDYNETSCGVRQAVDEYFLFGAKPYDGGCWIVYK